MIKNAVVHMNSEQPLLCDLRSLPTASDTCLVCTNLRYLSGAKPSFIDHVDSWFMMPLGIVRFVEIPQSSLDGAENRDGLLALPAGDAPDVDDSADAIDLRERGGPAAPSARVLITSRAGTTEDHPARRTPSNGTPGARQWPRRRRTEQPPPPAGHPVRRGPGATLPAACPRTW